MEVTMTTVTVPLADTCDTEMLSGNPLILTCVHTYQKGGRAGGEIETSLAVPSKRQASKQWKAIQPSLRFPEVTPK